MSIGLEPGVPEGLAGAVPPECIFLGAKCANEAQWSQRKASPRCHSVEEQLGQIWNNVEDALRAAVPEEVFAVWLGPLRPAGFNDGILYIEAPDRKGEWIRRRFGGILEAAASADEAVRRIDGRPQTPPRPDPGRSRLPS